MGLGLIVGLSAFSGSDRTAFKSVTTSACRIGRMRITNSKSVQETSHPRLAAWRYVSKMDNCVAVRDANTVSLVSALATCHSDRDRLTAMEKASSHPVSLQRPSWLNRCSCSADCRNSGRGGRGPATLIAGRACEAGKAWACLRSVSEAGGACVRTKCPHTGLSWCRCRNTRDFRQNFFKQAEHVCSGAISASVVCRPCLLQACALTWWRVGKRASHSSHWKRAPVVAASGVPAAAQPSL